MTPESVTPDTATTESVTPEAATPATEAPEALAAEAVSAEPEPAAELAADATGAQITDPSVLHALAVIASLEPLGSVESAAEAAAYHKVDRRYLGIAVPVLDDLARQLRKDLSLEDRLSLADALWASNVHEAMVMGAKLLEQARIRPDDQAAWDLILAWAPGFNGWAVSDHAAISGAKRLAADPARFADIAAWTQSENLWTRRAAFVITRPWAKMNNLKPADQAIREQVLVWAAAAVSDRNWFMQKAIGGWIADLSRHDAELARSFIETHGAGLKSFARKEAGRHLGA